MDEWTITLIQVALACVMTANAWFGIVKAGSGKHPKAGAWTIAALYWVVVVVYAGGNYVVGAM